MKKVVLSLVVVVVVLMILLVYANIFSQINTSIRDANTNIQVYEELKNIRVAVICQDLDACKQIPGLLSRAGVGELVTLDSLSKLAKRVDVVFMLSPSDIELLQKFLENGTTIVVPASIYESFIIPLLSRLRSALIAKFNGTSTYCIKFIDRLPDGRYVVAVHGIADEITSKTAIQEFALWFIKTANLKAEKVSGPLRSLPKSVPAIHANSSPPGVNVQNVVYTTSDSQPYWSTIGYVSWSSGDMWKPYGRLSIEHKVMQLINDGVANMDWDIVKCVTQGIPGAKLYNSGWTLEDFFNYYYLKYYTNIYELRNYNPTSMTNPVSVSVVLGEDVAIIVSWTYPGNYIDEIHDESDFYTDTAGWWHNIHGTSETLKIEPGFEFTVSPPTTGMQRWEISAQWGKWSGLSEDLKKTTLIVDVTFQY